MATKFSPCKGSYVLNQFPSNVMFGMNGFHVSESGAIQGHHGPLVYNLRNFWCMFCCNIFRRLIHDLVSNGNFKGKQVFVFWFFFTAFNELLGFTK